MNTKDAVIQSYMNLVIQKNTTDVKVADICHNANISRKTFYNYFADKQEILECIFCEEIEKTMINGLQYQVDEKKEVIATYKKFLKHKDFFMIAMKSEGQNSLFDIIITHCSSFAGIYMIPILKIRKNLIIYHINMLQAVRCCLKNGCMKEWKNQQSFLRRFI